MSKDAINQYDATAANNTDVGGISIDEGMLPSNVNNALREIMSHLKDVDAGTSSLTSPVISGDLTVDTDTLFVDSTNNRVLVGNTSSIGTVVAGKIQTTGIQSFITTNNEVGGFIGVNSNADNSLAIGADPDSDRAGSHIVFYVDGFSEKMRIDSSGRLLVGKTTNAIGTAGHTLQADGFFSATRSAAYVAGFNRLSDDGQIVQFFKDGTSVGSIISQGSSRIAIGTGDTGLIFNQSNESIHAWDIDGNTNRSNTIDLGNSSNTFKDLYLGGGAYIGGTGSANYLDDYEEGTFTPTYIGSTTNPTVTYERQNGHYVKIGRQVIATVELRTTSVSGGSGNIYVGGLPFTPVTVSGQARSGTANVGYTSTFNGSNPQSAYINGDYNAVILMTNSGTDARGPLNTAISISNLNTGGGSNFLMLTAIYIAD